MNSASSADTDEAPAWSRPGAADFGDNFDNERQPSRAAGFSATAHARGFVEDGKEQLVRTFDGLVQAAHEFADRLEGGAGGPVADYARRAAEAISGWQATIREKPVEELLDDGRDLIRRSPAIAIGVAVAAGFVLSRFLKAAR